jgi:mannosyltransferase OCH1-like enzyme
LPNCRLLLNVLMPCTCAFTRLLQQLGGVYADMDVQCLKPIDQWDADHGHDAAVLLGVENYDAGRQHPLHVVNWVLAAAPGHPLLGSMPGIMAKAVQQQFFQLAKTAGAVLHGQAYTNGIIDR